jgi:hypothetical protein
MIKRGIVSEELSVDSHLRRENPNYVNVSVVLHLPQIGVKLVLIAVLNSRNIIFFLSLLRIPGTTHNVSFVLN